MSPKSIVFAALLCGSVTAGCGATRPNHYYEITAAPASTPAAAASPYHVTLMVGPLTASRLYREDHIVFTTGAQDLGVYEYQRWADPPTEMIEDVLLRELRAADLFQGVYPWRSGAHGDYVLHGHLYDFREVSNGQAGRLTLELAMRDAKTGSDVWSHYYTHDEAVEGKDVSGVVTALDHNVQRGMAEFKASLQDYFSTHPRSSSSQ